jgi:hypothetical protein
MAEPIKWPATHDELVLAGWKFQKQTLCRACPVVIQWFYSPNGNPSPLELTPEDKYISHFATCPNAKDFRRPR